MKIQRWTSSKFVKIGLDKLKKVCKQNDGVNSLTEGEMNMEIVVERKHTNQYVKSNKKKVLEAIKKCNKKYARAMKELAK
ncbi:hypothetical protein [Clostridium botulinum]|uniref:hypothetical protein n=1 Tax=Clostridium botulinum TaxID=1491 RepID=UPI0004D45F21|nr:hypothetical protein [Clostridium botulinum]KEH96544.1 hypothetical protein Z953_p0123 [Clostridium botulinum D str. 16868]